MKAVFDSGETVSIKAMINGGFSPETKPKR
jgi:hypothetical protein